MTGTSTLGMGVTRAVLLRMGGRARDSLRAVRRFVVINRSPEQRPVMMVTSTLGMDVALHVKKRRGGVASLASAVSRTVAMGSSEVQKSVMTATSTRMMGVILTAELSVDGYVKKSHQCASVSVEMV